MNQDRKNYSVRPIIGYALISKTKENMPMSEKDINEIFNTYF